MRGVLGALALGLAAFAGGCVSTSAEERDPFYLHIAVGRWSHMISQVSDLTGHPYQPAEQDVDSLTDASALSARLREIVHGYNAQRAALCGQGKFVSLACGSPYTPPWIGERDERPPGIRALAQRSRTVGERIMPLWDAVCADARARVPDEEERRMVCAIE